MRVTPTALYLTYVTLLTDCWPAMDLTFFDTAHRNITLQIMGSILVVSRSSSHFIITLGNNVICNWDLESKIKETSVSSSTQA